jgi:hypothetical protein
MTMLRIQDVRARLGWNAEKDAEIQALIKATEAVFLREVDRNLTVVTDFDEVIRLPEESTRFRLKTYPVTAFKLAEWPLEATKPDLSLSNTVLLVEDVDYELNPTTGSVRFMYPPVIRRFVTRTSGGLLTGSPPVIPDDIREAITLQVMNSAVVNRNDSIGIQQRRQGGKSGDLVTFDRELGDRHTAFEEAIENYRRR